VENQYRNIIQTVLNVDIQKRGVQNMVKIETKRMEDNGEPLHVEINKEHTEASYGYEEEEDGNQI
jgi:hypothetical protein